MHRAIRTQSDELTEKYSIITGIDCTDLPDITRQEFKEETDVNHILARYGADAKMREPQYGTVDYDLDLQQALASIERAQDAIKKLPEPLRQKYYHWEMFLQGLYSGTLQTDLSAYIEKEKANKALTNKEAPVILQDTSNKE